MTEVDAVVVGAGPNGLAAAVTLARAGLRVQVFERNSTIGGGARTSELTLPGFRHDVCSAVHPMALASRFFREFRLARRIELRLPTVPYGAHDPAAAEFRRCRRRPLARRLRARARLADPRRREQGDRRCARRRPRRPRGFHHDGHRDHRSR